MESPISPLQIAGLWTCLMLAIAASSISITITYTEIFAPLRAWGESHLPHMLSYLSKCFYCMSHWVIFLGICIYRPILVKSNYLLADLTLSAFVTITLSALVSGLMALSFTSYMNMKMTEKELKQAMSVQTLQE